MFPPTDPGGPDYVDPSPTGPAPSAIDRAAEMRVLAAVFADPSLLDEVSEKLTSADFGVLAHEAVFEAITNCDASGRAVDVVTVADELTRAGQLKVAGGLEGVEKIASLGETNPEAVDAARGAAVAELTSFIDVVADRAVRRRLSFAGRKIVSAAMAGTAESATLIDDAEAAVFAVSSRAQGSTIQTMPQVVANMHDRMAKARHSRLLGHSWGFSKLDDITAGLQGGQLIVIAGRPGTGKSSLAADIGRHVAQVSGQAVPILSYEMPAADIGLRLLAAGSGAPLGELMRGHVPEGLDGVVAREAEKLAQTQLMMDDTPPSTINGVRSMLRRLARRTELGAVVVDYLQLMQGSSSRRDMNREGEVAEISGGLKRLAVELDIPIIACSQLNRGLESRPNKRPLLADLRESGSLEQDANVVVFVYRHHLYDPAADPRDAELIVAKNRNGVAPFTVYVDWHGDCTRFSDTDRTGPMTPEAGAGQQLGGVPAGGYGAQIGGGGPDMFGF